MEKRDLTPGSHLSAVARHTAASVEKSCSFEAYRSSQALLVPLGTALIIAAFAILHFGDLVSFDLGGNGRALGVLLDDARAHRVERFNRHELRRRACGLDAAVAHRVSRRRRRA